MSESDKSGSTLDGIAATIPACARPALEEAYISAGCDLTDYVCQCGERMQEITVSASQKVVEACGVEATEVLESTNALCEAVANLPSTQSQAPPRTVATNAPSRAASLSAQSQAPPRTVTTNSPSRAASLSTQSQGFPRTVTTNAPTEAASLTTQSEDPPRTTIQTAPSRDTQDPPRTISAPSSTSITAYVTSKTNPSAGTATSTATAATQPPITHSSGLSTGAKAGLGGGLAIGAVVLIVAIIFWRRRRNRKAQHLLVLGNGGNDREAQHLRVLGNEDYDGAEKADLERCSSLPLTPKPELPGTEAHAGSRFKVSPKPELAAASDARISDAVVEMEHREPTLAMPELESGERQQHGVPGAGNPQSLEKDGEEVQQAPKAAGQTIKRKEISSPVSSPVSPRSEPSPSLAGPLPSASELYPTPQTKDAVAAEEEETDFQYQERRLRERRAMIAERKRLAEEEEELAMEEEALRRKKATRLGQR